jgi:5'-deoxynucleotidase YfbR-like HD superfamily hydrolase
MNIKDVIDLSNLLAEMGRVKRATKLPSGEFESDSHHSFSLTLIAYHICLQECPQLNINKVVLYALAHDILEIITGDEDTLHYDAKQLAEKHAREKEAFKQFDTLFARYPAIKNAMYEYEKLDTPEAATVFVLDKASTTWTHHADSGAYARECNVVTKADVEAWAERQRKKFATRLRVMPPEKILEIYEASFEALRGLYEQ